MIKNIFLSLCLLTTSFTCYTQICVGEPGQVQWQVWRTLMDDEFGELQADEFYPTKSDIEQTVYRLQTPINYDNFMGGRLAGFLQVPESGDVTFNITGDDKVQLYLSTDESPDNKVLIAYTDDWTNVDEHDKYPEQTSAPQSLVAGEYYFFELLYVEASGGDHATVYWQSDFEDPENWTIITADYIFDVGCLDDPCPDRGTACDDGDSATVDDVEDGHCNCVGIPANANDCFGENGVQSFRYEGVPGGNLDDLYEDPDFPNMPNTSFVSSFLGVEKTNVLDDMGHLIQGFIVIPETGDYRFNITSDNSSIFYLSSDDTEENKEDNSVELSGWTGTIEHDKYETQSSDPIALTKGDIHFFEINHKEGGGSEHYSVFWETPFTPEGQWKRIPAFYLYTYDCTLACVPEGIACDDGNPFTNNDMYDANCQCVGTPCSGEDCDDPLASYIAYDKCAFTQEIDDREDTQWLSCEKSENPNSDRGLSHWISYDLGQLYTLFDAQVWNYNVANMTEKGFSMVAVDISLDGNTWTEHGIYNWPLAQGESNYSGFMGPSFDGAIARYVVFTALDSGDECKGLGKIAFEAAICPDVDTPCDDNDPMTIGDAYTADCECIGDPIDQNLCEVDTLLLGDTVLVSANYSAVDYVESISSTDTLSPVSLIAGMEVLLEGGFSIPAGSDVLVAIDNCDEERTAQLLSETGIKEAVEKEPAIFQILESDQSDEVVLLFRLEQAEKVDITLISLDGQTSYELVHHSYRNRGIYQKRFRKKKLETGVYLLKFKTDNYSETKRIQV